MTKPSASWRPNGPSARKLLLLAALLALVPAGASAADANAAGQAAGQMVLDKYGSKTGFNANISQPITNENTPLTSVDGTVSGSGQITAPSSRAFVQVAVQPSGTGDLSQVRVFQDLDLNGQYEYGYLVPQAVSGVCANGVISCAPGTWDDCNSFAWAADPAGYARLESTTLDALGGCYCLNSSCGSNLVWNNLALVLKDLGGGAVGALQGSRPSFVITDVKVDDAAIVYYGMDTSRAGKDQAGAALTGAVEQTQYYRNPGLLTSAMEGALLAQSADPDSYYSIMSRSVQDRQSPGSIATCEMSRDFTLTHLDITDVIVPLGGTGKVEFCGANCIDILLGRRDGGNYWYGQCTIFEHDAFRFYVKRPEMIQSATLVQALFDDYIQVWIGNTKVYNGPNENFPPETAGPCELSRNWNVHPNLDVTAPFLTEGELVTRTRVSVTGSGRGYAYIRVMLKPNRCVVDTSSHDTCTGLANNADCSLRDEIVDGVMTYQGFQPTGLTPLPSTRTETLAECVETRTMDWWEKKRTYLCQGQEAFDFTDAKKRLASVNTTVSTANPTDGSVYYTDLRKDSDTGTWVTDTHQLKWNVPEASAACQKVCKTRKVVSNAEVNLTGPVTQERIAPTQYEFAYKVCVNDTACPTAPGEEILKACQCINEFADAASAMAAINEAAKDLICSSGVKR